MVSMVVGNDYSGLHTQLRQASDLFTPIPQSYTTTPYDVIYTMAQAGVLPKLLGESIRTVQKRLNCT